MSGWRKRLGGSELEDGRQEHKENPQEIMESE